MERIFQLTAVTLGAIAAYFYWRGQTDAMFVSAVLGAVAFFLGIRTQVRTGMAERAAESKTHTSAE